MIRLSLEKVGILQKIDKFPNGIHIKISSEIYMMMEKVFQEGSYKN